MSGTKSSEHSRGYTLVDAPILTPNVVEGTTTLFEVDYHGDKAFLVAATGMVLNALLTDPINTGITFGIILAGVPVFYLWFRPRMAAGTEP